MQKSVTYEGKNIVNQVYKLHRSLSVVGWMDDGIIKSGCSTQ